MLLCDATRYADDDGGYDDNDNEDCGHIDCDANDDDELMMVMMIVVICIVTMMMMIVNDLSVYQCSMTYRTGMGTER